MLFDILYDQMTENTIYLSLIPSTFLHKFSLNRCTLKKKHTAFASKYDGRYMFYKINVLTVKLPQLTYTGKVFASHRL